MSAIAVQRPRALRPVPAERVEPVAAERSGRTTLLLSLATALVVVAAVFGVVGLNAMAANASVEARALEVQVGQAEVRYAELVAAVAAKEDPGRIRARALELGMVPAAAARHLLLSRGIGADGLRHPDAGTLINDPLKPVLTLER
jgi:hypothetical protein